MERTRAQDVRDAGLGISAAGIVIVGIICLALWGCPHYQAWTRGMHGEGLLREAESSRMILVQEAKAKMESSKLLAEAEVERARGVAAANKIIGDGLKDNESYLLYLWIQTLGDKDNHVIYIPTEGQLPILEAGRFKGLVHKSKDKDK